MTIDIYMIPTSNTLNQSSWIRDTKADSAGLFVVGHRFHGATVVEAAADGIIGIREIGLGPTRLTEDAPQWTEYARTIAPLPASWEYGGGIYSHAHRGPRRVRSVRVDLLREAERRITEIIHEGPMRSLTGSALRAALFLVESFAFDGAPTPQVARKSPAGLEIEWLVGNRSVTASCYDDGGVFLWATDANGDDLFEEEFSSWRAVRGDTYMQTVELLKAMGAEIAAPVARGSRA